MKPSIYTVAREGFGRLGIVARPRGDDWLIDEVAGFVGAGVTDLVSLFTEAESAELGLGLERSVALDAGLRFESFPIRDRGVPEVVALLELPRSAKGFLDRCASDRRAGPSAAPSRRSTPGS